MLWLCIQFPKLPLEALTRAQTPEEKNQPLAIVEKQIIVEANKAAFKSGIISGLNSATAQNLCPNLKLLQRNREKEQRHREELALWAFSFSPKISISAEDHKEGSHSSYLYIELGSGLKTNDGLRVVLDTMQQELTQIGISHYMGLSHSSRIALLLSQSLEHRQWLLKTHTPSTTQQWKQWIYQAPCKLLECDHKTIKKLYLCGFHRISQLLEAPMSEIEELFGRAFINYLVQLTSDLRKHVYTCQTQLNLGKEFFSSEAQNNPEKLILSPRNLQFVLNYDLRRYSFFPRQLHLQLLKRKEEKEINDSNAGCIQLQLGVQELLTQARSHLENRSILERKSSKKEFKKQNLIQRLTSRLGYQALSSIQLKCSI
ncbi:Y-family DNA polymerase [Microbulbifer sp. TRSA005]|uniref:Y-family DNA polymerase n=1 Tax=Microbulbifer sp. TRSA005 TaxID=3243383 RepID=UPI004039CFC6